MTAHLISHVGPFTIRTGRPRLHPMLPKPTHWECEAIIETDEVETDDFGCFIDPNVYCFVDHCNGSPEQAEAMHLEMINLCKSPPL
jgi:hypothetical protein